MIPGNIVNEPTYTQTFTTLTTSGTSGPMPLEGAGTAYIRVSGTNTAVSAVVQVSTSALSTGTFTTVPVDGVGSSGTARGFSILANGLYKVNVSGCKQIQVVVSSITGTNVTIEISAGKGTEFTRILPARWATYRVPFVSIAAAASSTTDVVTVTGAAGVITRVHRAVVFGTCASAAATAILYALRRSTANSVGTGITPVPTRKGSPAASSLAQSYTANPTPTLGTLVGVVDVGLLPMTVTGSTGSPVPLVFEFGKTPGTQEVELAAATDVFALSGNGVALGSTVVLTGYIEISEEV
jgi:hypothetical protein